MSISDVIKMALRNLWKRKLRTFLTILGVIIGTASIVVMVSIGIGMNESFQKQVEEWGSLQVINVYAAGSDRYYEEEEVQKDKKIIEHNLKKAIANGNEKVSSISYNFLKLIGTNS